MRFTRIAGECDHGVFIEAQGMPESYRAFSARFINLDHHPSPRPPIIARTLNPWLHNISPLPAACYVVWDMLRAADPPPPTDTSAWLVALGSLLDYCPAAAAGLIAQEQPHLAHFAELRDTFLAVQYVEPFTTDLASYLSTLPAAEELLAREPFAARRAEFQTRIAAARHTATITARAVVARTLAGTFRLASPLANRLHDEFPDHLIIVSETQPARARLSVRYRPGAPPVGATLARLATELVARGGGPADGTGHATAGSARVPLARVDDFLNRLLSAFHAA